MEYCDAEDLVFTSEEERYLSILNEISMAVRQVELIMKNLNHILLGGTTTEIGN